MALAIPAPLGTRVVMLGDSIVSDSYHESGVTFQSRVYSEVHWAAMGGDKLPWRHFAYKNLGNAFTTDNIIGGSLGIGGETSTGLRFGSTIIQAQHLQATLNLPPSIVVLAIGTNFGTTDGAAATVIANITAIIRRLIDEAGHHVVLANVRPRDDNHALYDARMNTINAWWTGYSDPDVTKWNANGALSSDGVGYSSPTLTRDGVHPTPRGAYTDGRGANADSKSLSFVLRSLLPDLNWFNDTLTAAANKSQNGRLTGTSGSVGTNVTGTSPTSWVVEGVGGTGVTCVASVEANAVTGGQNIVMTFTSTGGGSGIEEFRVHPSNITVATAGWASTEYIQQFYNVDVDDTANQILRGTETYLQGDAGRLYRGLGRFSVADTAYPQAAYTGWIYSDPMLVGAATTFVHRLAVFVDGATPGTAVVKLKGATVQSVAAAGAADVVFPYDGANHIGGQNVTPVVAATGTLTALVVVPPVVTPSGLIFSNTFSNNVANILQLQAFNTPVSGAASPYGIPHRLTLDTGVLAAYIEDTDPTTFGGIRSELHLDAQNINEDCWYLFDVRCDKQDWIQRSTEEISIFQVHALDTIPNTSINMSAVIVHGNLKIVTPIPEPPVNPIGDTLKASYPMPFDRWVKVAFHAYWKADDNGVIEVYLDGVPIFRQYNRGTAYTGDKPYLKMGCYDTFHTAAFGTRRAYYRNLEIWRGTASYSTVLRNDGGRPAVSPLILR